MPIWGTRPSSRTLSLTVRAQLGTTERFPLKIPAERNRSNTENIARKGWWSPQQKHCLRANLPLPSHKRLSRYKPSRLEGSCLAVRWARRPLNIYLPPEEGQFIPSYFIGLLEASSATNCFPLVIVWLWLLGHRTNAMSPHGVLLEAHMIFHRDQASGKSDVVENISGLRWMPRDDRVFGLTIAFFFQLVSWILLKCWLVGPTKCAHLPISGA